MIDTFDNWVIRVLLASVETSISLPSNNKEIVGQTRSFLSLLLTIQNKGMPFS